jgi:hypothetical protein
MSTTLLSFVASNGADLFDPTSVELSDQDGSFGVRRTDTGEVIVPSGTPMSNPQMGLWTYEFTDPSEGLSYECAIKVDAGAEPLYFTFYRYSPVSTVEPTEEGSSESVSDQERGIDLVCTEFTREAVEGRGDMFRATFRTQNPEWMPGEIFTYLKSPTDPIRGGDPIESFHFVATPFDSTIYPVGAPDNKQMFGFYRTDTIEFLVQSTKIAEELRDDLASEISALVAAYDRLDVLEDLGEVSLDGTGEQTAVDTTVDPVSEVYQFDAGEQLSLVEAEVAAAF